jgi:hypothetical protein
MRLRYFAILILWFAFYLAAFPYWALSNETNSLLQNLSTINCEGWTDSASAANLSTTDLLSSKLFSSSISDDLLKEFQVKDKEQRSLHRGQRKIFIEAYQFATTDGAFGAYCAARRGSSSYLAQGDASSEDQDSFSFYKNAYFVCLHSSETDDDEAKSAISKLARQLIQRLEPIKKTGTLDNTSIFGNTNNQLPNYSGTPAIFNSMPNLERVRGSEKLVMGPVSLRRFFNAPYAANLAPLLEGAIADYRIEEPHRDRLKLLIAYYQTNQQASATFANYVSVLSNQNDEKSAEGFSGATSLFKIGDSYLLCQLRDRRIIIIKGARHKDSLNELARQITL